MQIIILLTNVIWNHRIYPQATSLPVERMKRQKILQKLIAGSKNISFADMVKLVEKYNLRLEDE